MKRQKKKGPQDATRRNVQASVRRDDALRACVDALTSRVAALERAVVVLKAWAAPTKRGREEAV